ncbi:MAG: hypothetical protein AAFN77_11955 [Planctomycetota bacterium]
METKGPITPESLPTTSISNDDGMFSEGSYAPFMVGVFILGGFVALPLLYGGMLGHDYVSSLPWTLGVCVVFLFGFRRNGTISWLRATPVLLLLMIAAYAFYKYTGRHGFGVGGFLGFLIVFGCGYVGIGVRKLFAGDTK